MTTRLDLRIPAKLADAIATAADSVGLTDRAWARQALLLAARHRTRVRQSVPDECSVRLGIVLEPKHRATIDAAVSRSGMLLSEWCRAVLEMAASKGIDLVDWD